jgi:putative transposase
MEIETRRILHFNLTRHPTAEWTMQQFRECMIGDEGYKFIIHDRDSIYSSEVDALLRALELRVSRTPYRAPQANAFCERLIGSARRECLDFMIPINEDHVRWIMKEWTTHYNKSRPHSSPGPGIPDSDAQKTELQSKRHCVPKDHRIAVTPKLGGLHHEYRLQRVAA